jgi:CBS domain-containing protein
VKIDNYPAFTCGVIYPKSIFEGSIERIAEEGDSGETDAVEGGEEEASSGDSGDSAEQESVSKIGEAKSDSEDSSDSIQSFSFSQGGFSEFLEAHAEAIMDKGVVWIGPEASVQDALTAMQEHNVGHLMVGVDGKLEGIVSNSNVAGAVSPYLRPVFAKWRRPLDDASLNIKVKWIMTRPVRTVRSDSRVAVVIEDMRQFGIRCVPVADAEGKICGVVTVFDILSVLNGSAEVQTKGDVVQAPVVAV